jgi:hypothetical protein
MRWGVVSIHAVIMPDLGACTEADLGACTDADTIRVDLALTHVTRLASGVKLGSAITDMTRSRIRVNTDTAPTRLSRHILLAQRQLAQSPPRTARKYGNRGRAALRFSTASQSQQCLAQRRSELTQSSNDKRERCMIHISYCSCQSA